MAVGTGDCTDVELGTLGAAYGAHIAFKAQAGGPKLLSLNLSVFLKIILEEVGAYFQDSEH